MTLIAISKLGRVLLVASALGLAAQACAENDGAKAYRPHSAAKAMEASRSRGGACEPGAKQTEDPLGTCFSVDEHHVPDLTLFAATPAAMIDPASLVPLDAPVAQAVHPSCAVGAGPGINTCGANGTDTCCAIAPVPGGRAGTIEVASFELGTFEVTSGRFAAFVASTGGNIRQTAATAGWAGWDPAWTDHLPASRAAVDDELGPGCKFRSDVREFGALTWPSADVEAAVASLMTDDNETAADIRADATADRLHLKPINCVSYWMAAAFCAWDGGRLPTNDEWVYASMGGDELREYAWPKNEPRTPDKLVTDFNRDTSSFTFPDDFPFFDNGMNAYHIAPPGRKPAGVARWGHHDMIGNLLEWTAETTGGQFGTVRGGSWEGHEEKNSFAYSNYPLDRTYGSLGFRCAYGTPMPPPRPQAPVMTKVPIHRAFDAATANHLLDRTPPAAGVPEGIAFRVLETLPAPGAGIELRRCVTAAGGHFLSTDAACEAQRQEGVLGWVLAASTTEAMPLYRCLSPDGRDHLSTVVPAECERAGYRIEGTQGFVFGPPPADFIASLYREALGRDPEPAGHVAWLTSVALGGGCNATTLGALIDGIVASPEFEGLHLDAATRVQRLYRAGLSRDPEPEGGANARAALEAGTPWPALVHSVATSPEAASYAARRCSP